MSPDMLLPTDYDPWGGQCKNLNGRGAYILQGYLLAESPWTSIVYNSGIYNCRPPSVHGEERAGDTGVKLLQSVAHPRGQQIADWLWANRDHFGIQLVIWNRKIISRVKPTWRDYNGPSPHIDHVHWELNWWGYWHLTREIINAHLPSQTPNPLPTPPTQPDDLEEPMYRIIGADGVPALYEANEELTMKSGIPNLAAYEELKAGKGFGGHFRMGPDELRAVPLRHTGQPGL